MVQSPPLDRAKSVIVERLLAWCNGKTAVSPTHDTSDDFDFDFYAAEEALLDN